jgi:hypothetical protein
MSEKNDGSKILYELIRDGETDPKRVVARLKMAQACALGYELRRSHRADPETFLKTKIFLESLGHEWD